MRRRSYLDLLAAAVQARRLYGDRAKRINSAALPLPAWVADVEAVAVSVCGAGSRELRAVLVCAALAIEAQAALARQRVYEQRGDAAQAGKAAVLRSRAERHLKRLRRRRDIAAVLARCDLVAERVRLRPTARPTVGNTKGAPSGSANTLAEKSGGVTEPGGQALEPGGSGDQAAQRSGQSGEL